MYFPMAACIFLRTSSLVTRSLYALRWPLILKALVFFSGSVVKIHDLQAYRNMDGYDKGAHQFAANIHLIFPSNS